MCTEEADRKEKSERTGVKYWHEPQLLNHPVIIKVLKLPGLNHFCAGVSRTSDWSMWCIEWTRLNQIKIGQNYIGLIYQEAVMWLLFDFYKYWTRIASACIAASTTTCVILRTWSHDAVTIARGLKFAMSLQGSYRCQRLFFCWPEQWLCRSLQFDVTVWFLFCLWGILS